MSKRAKEAALKAYPKFIEYYPHVPSSTCGPDGFTPAVKDHNAFGRQLFQEGYEQAEKDLALTWEDIAKIDAIILDVNNEFALDYSKEIDRQKFYEEVLKRFKEAKK